MLRSWGNNALTNRQTHRHTQRHTDTQTHTQTHRHTHTHAQTDRQLHGRGSPVKRELPPQQVVMRSVIIARECADSAAGKWRYLQQAGQRQLPQQVDRLEPAWPRGCSLRTRQLRASNKHRLLVYAHRVQFRGTPDPG